MPQLPFSQALTANQLGFNPISGWQYEFVPAVYGRGAVVQIILRTTGAAGTVLAQISTGGQTIQERSPIQAGGTAGVTPSVLNTAPVTFLAAPGDRLKISIDETAGATPTVDGLITMEPSG